MKRHTKDKQKAIKQCLEAKREIVWSDALGYWHCATNIANTPHWATEVFEASTGLWYVSRNGLWRFQCR